MLKKILVILSIFLICLQIVDVSTNIVKKMSDRTSNTVVHIIIIAL